MDKKSMIKFIGWGFGTALIPCVITGFFPTIVWWALPAVGAVSGAWLSQPEQAKWHPMITACLAIGGALMGLCVLGIKSIIY
jgi:hypothetical protein